MASYEVVNGDYITKHKKFSRKLTDEHSYIYLGKLHYNDKRFKDEKFCPQWADIATISRPGLMDGMYGDPIFEEGKIPTKYIKCPECGRRVKLRIGFCHDSCCIYFGLPPHKPKYWWKKKNKKTSKDIKNPRIKNRIHK